MSADCVPKVSPRHISTLGSCYRHIFSLIEIVKVVVGETVHEAINLLFKNSLVFGLLKLK